MGCCVHVATFIYYLSWAKFNDVRIPGEHLNSIFVDLNQKTNEPTYVKGNRINRVILSSDESSDDNEESSDDKEESSDDNDESLDDIDENSDDN
jgi:hypothetical protein